MIPSVLHCGLLFIIGLSLLFATTQAFQFTGAHPRKSAQLSVASSSAEAERTAIKRRLLDLLDPPKNVQSVPHSIFIDRLTKEPLSIEQEISTTKFVTGDDRSRQQSPKILLRSSKNTYVRYPDSYYDLLEPYSDKSSSQASATSRRFTQALVPLLPPPLRSSLSTLDPEFRPMRDLFTNPAVSFAYERGWRQGFAQAGFPGVEREAEMANDYFAPVVAASTPSLLVDMSCATGLFTRRFADSNKYGRVLGCDYSPSMLEEAIRRRPPIPGRLDWVRLDVGDMPFADASVDVLHAGAAMHCWPELDKAASEIYRVLKPGGRYFATTFLSSYFSNLQNMDGASEPSKYAFQYFQSTEQLRKLMQSGGFDPEKIQAEVLGNACVVIRCEK